MAIDRFLSRTLLTIGVVAAALAGLAVRHAGRAHRPVAPIPASPETAAQVRKSLAAMPLVFEQNRGQYSTTAPFVARGNNSALAVSPSETSLALRQHTPSASSAMDKNEGASKWAIVRTRLLGADTQAKILGERLLGARLQHFTGASPAEWQTDISAFERIRTTEVYPGIDLVHYGNQAAQLEYDFELRPHAAPEAIQLQIEGADTVDLAANGDLRISIGDASIVQKKPFSYQTVDGKQVEIPTTYRLDRVGDRFKKGPGPVRVSFNVGEYDPAAKLTIDPVLVYSSYVGGNTDATTGEHGVVAVSDTGMAYVAGYSGAPDFPTTAGAYQTDPGDFRVDAFLAVIDPTKTGVSSIVYSSYLGGGGIDVGRAIAVDGSGKAYIAGLTGSSDFPTTASRFQSDPGDGSTEDAFLAVIDPSLSGVQSLVYSTYLGGTAAEAGNAIAIAEDGKVCIAGGTISADFPTTFSRFQSYQGTEDVFVAVLDITRNPSQALVYSSYLGGDLWDAALGVASGPGGRFYVAGRTDSIGFPTTPGRFQTDPNDSNEDGVFAVIDPSLTGVDSLVYSTYLGGSGQDLCSGIDVDGFGNAYLVGLTRAADFPTTSDQYQGDSGDVDTFVSVIDPSQSGELCLLHSTLLGGNDEDWGTGIALREDGKVCVVGDTSSVDFPTTSDALMGDPDDNAQDAFVSVLDLSKSGAEVLAFSTYLGGSAADIPSGVDVGPTGLIYVSGINSSPDFPTTASRFQSDQPGQDAWIAVIDSGLDTPPAPPSALVASAVSSTGIKVTWKDKSSDESGFKVERKAGSGAYAVVASLGAGATTVTDSGLAPNTRYTYRVRAFRGSQFSAYSNEATARTLPLPFAPSGLAAAAVSASRINLIWKDNSSDEAGFKIERKSGAGTYAVIASVGAGVVRWDPLESTCRHASLSIL